MLRTYNDISIQKLWWTPLPSNTMGIAVDITQKRDPWTREKPLSPGTLEFLLKANHTSLLEHAVICVYITNVSRSFLAQITRHRMSSFTCSSQHYQEYSQYDDFISPSAPNNVAVAIQDSNAAYHDLVVQGVPVHEARQVLPNSKGVNILWTINARSLVNFLNLRMCHRNVEEMRIFAEKMLDVAIDWWPDLFLQVEADCQMPAFGKACRQGKMYCGRKGVKFV